MVNYVNKAHTFNIDSVKEDLLVLSIPLHGVLTADNPLWSVRDQYDTTGLKSGDSSIYKSNSKWIWVMYPTWFEEAPSNSVYISSRETFIDNQKNRLLNFKRGISGMHSFCKEQNIKSIASPPLLCGIYKDTLKKHLSDIEYFIRYIEPLILQEVDVDWTVYNRITKVVRKDKTNNYKIDNFNETYDLNEAFSEHSDRDS